MAQQMIEDVHEAARAVLAQQQRQRKVTVTQREYAWVLNEDNGEVNLHTGPCQISPTTGENVVEDDGSGGYKRVEDRTRKMIEVGDGQYAVLFNPLQEGEAGFPNGKFKTGRNEPKELNNGTKQMIPGPCSFYLRPGQRAEVRNAHALGSNQYLVVKVYGELDHTAPYYDITRQSAKILTFTTVGLDSTVVADGKTDASISDKLERGRLIVIRGIDTRFYIPPTGVEVVPDTSCDLTGSSISGDRARDILQKALKERDRPRSAKAAGTARGGGAIDGMEVMLSASTLDHAPTGANLYSASNIAVRGFSPSVEQAGRRRHRVAKDANDYQALLGNLRNDPTLRAEFAKAASQIRLVREAVVLTEKEFCVIVDADGRRNVTKGPARVFPGPNDTFMIEGSRSRVYDAYELLPTRALWLRVITPIAKADLATKLPPNSLALLSKDTYHPGDEILLKSLNAFFFPFNEIEVLSPTTGSAEVGNDHERVFIEAIGIDQKSGIYVRDLTTGEAKLVRGLKSYLVDPAKEVHIARQVSAIDWNHWIFAQRPHKRVQQDQSTPWALSIRVPNNTAIMAVSAKKQRVIIGPCVELLEYEEKLAYLNLSTGTPKADNTMLKTCFLRIRGNRVSDRIRVQTADFVPIDITVSYRNQFLEEHKDSWFHQENYVQAMVDHLRSLVRNVCRRQTLGELWPVIPDVVRDTILGVKDPETGERTGRFFEENGMIVTEVEVLNSEILDETLSLQFSKVQRNLVALQIGDQEAKAKLASDKVRATVDAEGRKIREITAEQIGVLEDVLLHLSTKQRLAEVDSRGQIELAQREATDKEALRRLENTLDRKIKDSLATVELTIQTARAESESQELRDIVTLKMETERNDLEKFIIETKAAAEVSRNESVQEGLIEALQSLGNKLVLTESAKNMNLISLIKGESFGDIFKNLFEGTTAAKSIGAIGTMAAVKGYRGMVEGGAETNEPWDAEAFADDEED